MTRSADDQAIRIGISRCILGEEVRYNGGHKRDRLVTEQLGQFFSFVPVCPEVEVGMGIPREAVHLEGALDVRNRAEAPQPMDRVVGGDDQLNRGQQPLVVRRQLGQLKGSRSRELGEEHAAQRRGRREPQVGGVGQGFEHVGGGRRQAERTGSESPEELG